MTNRIESTAGDAELDAMAAQIGPLGTCEVCGNVYDKAFEVVMAGVSHVFDSFECAIHALAPTCAHCGCRIIGHGMEHAGEMYCCVHCAQASGVDGLKDRT